MRHFGIVLIVLLLSMIFTSAHARRAKAVPVEIPEEYVNKVPPRNATVWYCWYDGNVHVQCKLGEVAQGEDAAAAGAATQAASAVDPRLPGIVRQVWHQAASLVGVLIGIPLHTIPFDMSMTGQLAESVMCGGSSKPCGIIFANSATLLAQLVEARRDMLAIGNLGGFALAD